VLTAEDSLRLNVLVATAEAIRIDEGRLCVYGLDADQELKVELNPNCRAEQYLSQVRELLSGAVLGSPGGYPVFLRRWTRMGQVDNDQLDKLLKIGEPEAVIAVSCAPSLTDDLARRAWWAAPEAENARRMLKSPAVVAGHMGRVLAEYLIDYLPFESEHRDAIESVRLVLQPGLVDEATQQRLWEAGRNRRSYRVGFLAALPDALPDAEPARIDLADHAAALMALVAAGNGHARLLQRLMDAPGQTFLREVQEALRRPADQEVYSAILEAVGGYFRGGREAAANLPRGVEALSERVVGHMAAPPAALADLLNAVPTLAAELAAMETLALVSDALVVSIFAHSSAVGSVMRKKVEPVTQCLSGALSTLRGGS